MKKIFYYLMPVFYILAGLNHFKDPGFYLQMMPPYVPAHEALNLIAGAAEIILGLGLLFEKTRKASAWGVILLLIAVFPANLYMYTDNIKFAGKELPDWVTLVRLPFQLVFIGWAYLYTKPSKKA